jgi:hypothetical protein
MPSEAAMLRTVISLLFLTCAGVGALACARAAHAPGPTASGTPAPLIVHQEAVAALTNFAFTSDLRISYADGELHVTFDGDFQAPDRVQGTISIKGAPYEQLITDVLGRPAEGEVAVIGEDTWWRDDANAWHAGERISEETADPLVMFRQYATPYFYLDALQFENLRFAGPGPAETVNGVRAIAVRLDKEAIVALLPQGTDLNAYPDEEHQAEGVFPGQIENAQQVLPESFSVTVWFHQDELYPVRILFDYDVTESDYANLAFGFGKGSHIRLQMDITDPDAGADIAPRAVGNR